MLVTWESGPAGTFGVGNKFGGLPFQKQSTTSRAILSCRMPINELTPCFWGWFVASLSGIGSWKRQIDMCQWVVSQCQSPTNRNVQDL